MKTAQFSHNNKPCHNLLIAAPGRGTTGSVYATWPDSHLAQGEAAFARMTHFVGIAGRTLGGPILVVDVNEDGHEDLLLGSKNGETAHVLYNQGAGIPKTTSYDVWSDQTSFKAHTINPAHFLPYTNIVSITAAPATRSTTSNALIIAIATTKEIFLLKGSATIWDVTSSTPLALPILQLPTTTRTLAHADANGDDEFVINNVGLVHLNKDDHVDLVVALDSNAVAYQATRYGPLVGGSAPVEYLAEYTFQDLDPLGPLAGSKGHLVKASRFLGEPGSNFFGTSLAIGNSAYGLGDVVYTSANSYREHGVVLLTYESPQPPTGAIWLNQTLEHCPHTMMYAPTKDIIFPASLGTLRIGESNGANANDHEVRKKRCDLVVRHNNVAYVLITTTNSENTAFSSIITGADGTVDPPTRLYSFDWAGGLNYSVFLPLLGINETALPNGPVWSRWNTCPGMPVEEEIVSFEIRVSKGTEQPGDVIVTAPYTVDDWPISPNLVSNWLPAAKQWQMKFTTGIAMTAKVQLMYSMSTRYYNIYETPFFQSKNFDLLYTTRGGTQRKLWYWPTISGMNIMGSWGQYPGCNYNPATEYKELNIFPPSLTPQYHTIQPLCGSRPTPGIILSLPMVGSPPMAGLLSGTLRCSLMSI